MPPPGTRPDLCQSFPSLPPFWPIMRMGRDGGGMTMEWETYLRTFLMIPLKFIRMRPAASI